MQTNMTGRPRPVTATVTKPRWMQIPSPSAMRKIRSRSVDSHASTDSLTSYNNFLSDSEPDEDINSKKDNTYICDTADSATKANNLRNSSRARKKNLDTKNSNNNNREISPAKSKLPDGSLSAWEKWLIHKAKEDQKKHKADRKKQKEEKLAKEKEEQEKAAKLKKAEVVRQQWTEQKNKEEIVQKKIEKVKIRDEKRKKEELEMQIKEKAQAKFSQWAETKKKEDKEKRRQSKEERLKIQQHEENRKVMAEKKFQEWLRQAASRPQSAPNSFGYLAGKMTGYHDRSAYPQPSFYNPLPWHPPAVAATQKSEKSHKPKVKPYKWDPEKYF